MGWEGRRPGVGVLGGMWHLLLSSASVTLLVPLCHTPTCSIPYLPPGRPPPPEGSKLTQDRPHHPGYNYKAEQALREWMKGGMQ